MKKFRHKYTVMRPSLKTSLKFRVSFWYGDNNQFVKVRKYNSKGKIG